MTAESVRLVVWDLDETFWRGTLTEGGIREYVQAHHDIVIELARRGILSSICSKNDAAPVLAILAEKGILDYFVFPSISWEPKGMRLAQLVETVQLRAPTIMFIDDNPNNRGEAAAVVPGLQVEDETFIPRMLADPRFKGKDDSQLTRLKQYKLLEERKRDEASTAGSNEDFLRGCDVRVHIEYDIETHIDRAVELINRTNQLNYTKKRLSEDPETARQQLRDHMRPFDRVAGLVRVADKYGDYGYVGFFMTGGMRKALEAGAANTHLFHFCFSCRTLGMLIEQWLYEHLGRPELKVVGEVLTDLTVPRRIDWVRLVSSMDGEVAQQPKIAPQIVLYGGCEANVVGIYLNAYTDRLEVYGNYVANGIFVVVNFAARILEMASRDPEIFPAEADILGLPLHLETGDVFATAEPGALFVFNLIADSQGCARLRHKKHGWLFALASNGVGAPALLSAPEEELRQQLAPEKSSFTPDQQDSVLRVCRHLRDHYELVTTPKEPVIVSEMHDLLARVPVGSKCVILVPHDQARPKGAMDSLRSIPHVTRYRTVMQGLTADYPYAGVVSFTEVINTPDEILRENHYHREVYVRLVERIAEVAATLQPRSEPPRSHYRLPDAQASQPLEVA
jgi:FkbH-like protein